MRFLYRLNLFSILFIILFTELQTFILHITNMYRFVKLISATSQGI